MCALIVYTPVVEYLAMHHIERIRIQFKGRGIMSSQYLYRITPVRDGFLLKSTPEEDAIVGKHFQYLQSLTAQGVVLLAGRTLHTDVTSHGLVLLAATTEENAQGIMENDPAVKAGIFRAELFPFSVALVSEQILPS